MTLIVCKKQMNQIGIVLVGILSGSATSQRATSIRMHGRLPVVADHEWSTHGVIVGFISLDLNSNSSRQLV